MNPDEYHVPKAMRDEYERIMTDALNEAGYRCRFSVRNGTRGAYCSATDEEWVRASNLARMALGVPTFPDVQAWRACIALCESPR